MAHRGQVCETRAAWTREVCIDAHMTTGRRADRAGDPKPRHHARDGPRAFRPWRDYAAWFVGLGFVGYRKTKSGRTALIAAGSLAAFLFLRTLLIAPFMTRTANGPLFPRLRRPPAWSATSTPGNRRAHACRVLGGLAGHCADCRRARDEAGSKAGNGQPEAGSERSCCDVSACPERHHKDDQEPDAVRVQRLERAQIAIGELGPDDESGDCEDEGVRDLGVSQDARCEAMQRRLRRKDDGDRGAQSGSESRI